MESEVMSHLTEKVDNTALTHYKHKLDAKYPIRQRDLRFPGRASLLGCIWTKFVVILVTAALLIMRSLGLDGGSGMPDPLAPSLVFFDIAIGCLFYGIISLFAYFYIRIRSAAIAIVLFAIGVAAVFVALGMWNLIAQSGNEIAMVVLGLLMVAAGVVPFAMDVWGFITYDQKVAQGKAL